MHYLLWPYRCITTLINRIKALYGFRRSYKTFRQQARAAQSRFTLAWSDRFPCLDDATATTSFDPHYIYFPAWAARVLARTKPTRHVDISSSLHFCTLVSAFVPTEFYDYRPADLKLSQLVSGTCDLNKLSFTSNSLESVSCMHVVEHVGLGRYGDALDYDGDVKAVAELKRVVKPGGTLLFVVPVGQARIQYNAHRIYGYDQVVAMFEGFELKEFVLVTDQHQEGLIINANPAMVKDQRYGCGCFWWVKKKSR